MILSGKRVVSGAGLARHDPALIDLPEDFHEATVHVHPVGNSRVFP